MQQPVSVGLPLTHLNPSAPGEILYCDEMLASPSSSDSEESKRVFSMEQCDFFVYPEDPAQPGQAERAL